MKIISLLSLMVSSLLMAACSSNPTRLDSGDNKAREIKTEIVDHGKVADETLGVKDGEMIIQRKALLSEELRSLQNEVYEMDYNVYGNPQGSRGLYGALKDCRKELAFKKDGEFHWTEEGEHVTSSEGDLRLGMDEKGQLVALSEEYIKDRILRFRGYKKILEKRKSEYQDKVDVCKLELAKIEKPEKVTEK